MGNIYDVLSKIRENPALYFGGYVHLDILDGFIGGYHFRGDEISGKPYGTNSFARFQAFVQIKYRVSLSKRWTHIIEFYSSGHREAWETFYELLDEFIATQNPVDDGSVDNIELLRESNIRLLKNFMNLTDGS